MTRFRVALSSDFLNADGTPAVPMFDLAPLHRAGAEIAYVEAADGVMRAADLAGFDALILLTHRFDRRSIPADGRLAIVARFGVGYDTVDVPACTAAGIALAITPDGVRRPVAVTVLTFMLALASRLFAKDRLTRMGPPGWAIRSRYMGMGLTGRTLGLLGVGNIGAEVLRLAAPLDMRFIAHDPFIDAAKAQGLGADLVDIETLFREADFLSVNVPLSDKTRGLVGERLLGLMKPTAYLINTARGPIVDQRALYEALAAGRLAGAGLDVFEVEPAPADEPLFRLDNVIVTPHALCFTDECFAGNGAADVRAVLAVMNGETPAHLVNPEVVETPQWRRRTAARATG
ncbi:MAG: dehydrogenase [Microvirga sp.]|jgi:phosphoglycerate dehydrogenase-like enzyme|nr:dehydrogenase [Microvirga sp.]